MYRTPYAKLCPPIRKPFTEIFLVRHCNPNYTLEKKLGADYMPLSKAGILQRKFLTKKLLKLGIKKAYSSALVRSQETAKTYISRSGNSLIIDPLLNEIDWIDWHRIKYFNMTEGTRVKRFKYYKDLDRKLDKIQTQARLALTDIFNRNRGQKVVIFSHGNFIKALLTSIMNADILGFLSLEVFQSSVSKLVIDRDGYVKISYINDASHLPTLPQEDLYVSLVD